MAIAAPSLLLPWSSSTLDNRRFYRILWVLLGIFFLLGLIIPFIHVPEPQREDLERVPAQLARVLMEEKELPPPPPPPPPREEPKPEPKPEEPEPEPKPEPRPEPKPEPEPVKLQQAQEQARKSGVLQFADDLAAMRDAMDVSEVRPDNASLTRATGEAAQVDRSVVTSGAKAKSGGVNTAALSRDTGGVALSGRETTTVESKMEEVSAATGRAREASASGDVEYRPTDGVRQKLDAAKGRIYNIYARALRQNPALRGKVEFKLVIEPDGSVSDAQVVSSELNDDDLERRLLAAIRFIDFGAANVLQTTLNYTYDFLPN